MAFYQQNQYPNQFQNQRRSGGTFSNAAINRTFTFEDSFGGEQSATYAGIFAKVGYFMIITFLGVAAFFYMHSYFGSHGYTVSSTIAEGYVVYSNEMAIMIGAWIITLIAGLVAAFAIKTIPVSGTIYCAGMGYAVAITSYIYAAQYSGIVVEALVLTILIIAAMAVLYYTGIVKVGEKFKTIVFTALIASVIGGAIFGLLAWLAPNSTIVKSILKVQSGPLGILFAVLGVLLAAALLLIDFDTIAEAVTNNVNKKYEWYCSYSLMLSVILLYLKVLRLLARLQNNK
ncbi:MAG: Bax inhibitor-1/YccA family protein [Ruminococcus sp.]|nr:Bax inhibitor-1/YccA family protein [Ruminococcus sp.]